MTDINELFSRDPLKLTDDNIDEIIEEMRAKRHLFNSGAGTVKKAPAKSKLAKEGSQLKAKLGLDIDL